MRKFVILIFMLILLTACGAPEAIEPVEDPLVENSDAPIDSEPVSKSEVESVSSDAITPARTAAEAGILRDRDWTKGAEDPLITIIEYGDFQ